MKTDSQWLDKFVKMDDKWKKDAEGWLEYMEVSSSFIMSSDFYDMIVAYVEPCFVVILVI